MPWGLILQVAGNNALAGLLIGIVVFLARKVINNHYEHIRDDIEKLDGKVTGIGQSLDLERAERKEKYEGIDKQLTKVSQRVEDMDKDVERIKNRMNGALK